MIDVKKGRWIQKQVSSMLQLMRHEDAPQVDTSEE